LPIKAAACLQLMPHTTLACQGLVVVQGCICTILLAAVLLL
jgi:hypothetical protein